MSQADWNQCKYTFGITDLQTHRLKSRTQLKQAFGLNVLRGKRIKGQSVDEMQENKNFTI